MGKQRIIKLNLNRTFVEKSVPSDATTIKAGKNDKVDFTPSCVFTEEKTKFLWKIPRFWKIPRNLVFFVDGAKKCLEFSEDYKDLQIAWTKNEATEHVKKEIAKARVKESLISWGKAILILILLGVVIFLQLYSMSRIF